MLTDIFMKFREDSLNGFQVKQRTQFVTDKQSSKVNNSKSKNAKAMVLALCKSFNVD